MTTGTESYLDFSPELLTECQLDLRRLTLLLCGLAIGSFILLMMTADDWIRLLNQILTWQKKLKDYCFANRYFLIYAFICLILFFGYELFNSPISADDDWYLLHNFEYHENNMPSAFSQIYSFNTLTENYFNHGRWASALMVQLFPGFSPVISLFSTLLCLFIIFVIFAEKLKLPTGTRYLLFPFFIGYPVLYEYYTFNMVSPIFGIAFLISFLISIYWQNTRSWFSYILLLLVSTFSICVLQTLFILYPLMFLMTIMSECLEHRIDYKQVLHKFWKLCIFCLLNLLVYFLSVKYTVWLFETEVKYVTDFLKRLSNWNAVMEFFANLLQLMLSLYSGGTAAEFIPSFTAHGQLLILLLMIGAILGFLIKKRYYRLLDKILMHAVLIGILILPFVPNAVSFNIMIPGRSLVTLPLVITGLCILGWRALENHDRIRFAAGLLIVMVAVQYCILCNMNAYSSKLRYKQDRAVLQSIKERCYQIPELAANMAGNNKIPLAAVGLLRNPIPGTSWSGKMMGPWTFPFRNQSMLNCLWEPGVVINFHLQGETYFYPVSKLEMRRIFPVASLMPCWPAAGSVRYEDGILLVKFSDFDNYQLYRFGLPRVGNRGIQQIKAMLSTSRKGKSIEPIDSLPSNAEPVWELKQQTLNASHHCSVKFTEKGIVIRPSGWHFLLTKDIHADPNKIYYLRIKIKNSKKNGLIYLGFFDFSQLRNEIYVQIDVPYGNSCFSYLISGQYLEGPISIDLGDWPDKEQIIEEIVLLEEPKKNIELLIQDGHADD